MKKHFLWVEWPDALRVGKYNKEFDLKEDANEYFRLTLKPLGFKLIGVTEQNV